MRGYEPYALVGKRNRLVAFFNQNRKNLKFRGPYTVVLQINPLHKSVRFANRDQNFDGVMKCACRCCSLRLAQLNIPIADIVGPHI